ncbi:hypothetical protein [Arthrobacter sp. YN]|uniref:hypothetical protein n=1 Tax=Arthrobacter sp. YN TaxID=2020486 RepID=UPI0018DFAE9F|nr:hypothetical protein [Arthrobacter sp. YN]
MTDMKKFDPKALIKAGLNKALDSQQPVAVANVARLRRVHPDKSPAELIAYMNKWYIGTVSAAGVGAGAAAVVPNGFVQVPAALADLLTYLEASVLYTLSVAEIHRLDLEDIERRRLLVTGVLVGNSASTQVLEKVIGRAAPYWGKKVVQTIPMAAIDAANKVLGPRFITKWGTKQGILVLGKQVPLMIGAAIGGGGNGLFGWVVVKSARKVLGPAPESWDVEKDENADSSPANVSPGDEAPERAGTSASSEKVPEFVDQ